MSETWHGITLAEVINAGFRNIRNNLRTVHRLISSDGTEYTFDTATKGAVIAVDNYLTWEFIAPQGFLVTLGDTVGDFFDNLAAAEAAHSVQAWDDFAVFLSDNAALINGELTQGAPATVTLAAGTSYSASVPLVTTFSDFSDLTLWLKGWMGAAALAADAAEAFDGGDVRFSLTAEDTTISCTFRG